MKPVRQAIVLVDAYRRPSRRRNTAGRYQVGAKTEKEAEELVRKAVGFGSVKFYYWEGSDDKDKPKVGYKQVMRDIPRTRLADTTYDYEPARHACAPLPKKMIQKRSCRFLKNMISSVAERLAVDDTM